MTKIHILKKLSMVISLFLWLVLAAGAQEWHTDLAEAEKAAADQDRNIILVFQGSDWCAPCIKLENEIWSSEEFKNYAHDHFILLKADFPKKRDNKLSPEQQEKNNLLAEKYNVEGYFPLVVVLDKNGKVLGKTGYKKMTPAEYIELLSSF